MLPQKKTKKSTSKSRHGLPAGPSEPSSGPSGEGDAAPAAPGAPAAPVEPSAPTAPTDFISLMSPVPSKGSRSSRDGHESKSPGGRKKSKSPGGRKKSKSPGGRKKSKSPRGRKKSKSPRGRKKSKSRSRSPKRKLEPEPEPEPEPWRPRSDSQVPDYEAIRVTESLLPVRDEFLTVINHLAVEERFKNYSSEFVRMFERIAKAHDTKHELAAAVDEQAVRLDEAERTASRLAGEAGRGDEEVSSLRRQVEELRAEVDASRTRELDSKGMIDNLREAVGRCQEQMRLVVLPTEENEAMVDYEKLKKKFVAEHQELAETNQGLKKKLAEMDEQLERQHLENVAANVQVTNLHEKLKQVTQDVHREVRNKEKLEEDMECLVEEHEEQVAKNAEQAIALLAAERDVAAQQKTVKEQRAHIDRVTKEKDKLAQGMKEQRCALDRLRAELERVKQDHRDKTLEVSRQEEAINRLRVDETKARRGLENTSNRLGAQMQKNKQLEGQRLELAGVVKAVDRDLDRCRLEADQERRQVADLVQDRDLLVSKVVRGEQSFRQTADNLVASEQQCLDLEAELEQCAKEAVKQRKLITNLEQERDFINADRAELRKQVHSLTDQLILEKKEVLDYQRELQLSEDKIQAQVKLTDAMVQDRNRFEKLFEEARTVRDDLKAQAQVMSASELQLKETLNANELEAKRLSHALAKAEGEKACMARELNELQLRARQLEAVIGDLEKGVDVLHRGAAKLERERDGLHREVRGVRNERDIIGTQLVRRNDEIHLLLAKIDVLQTMLASGEEEYTQRLDDIRLLKLEVRKLRQERVLLQRDLMAGADLRRELYHLSKDLAFEKQRRAALETELKTPMNLHRWRRLEASDPASLELIQKVNLLQKRLLSQHSLLLVKERQLQDADKLYLALRSTVVKLPGPDVLLRLKKVQLTLHQRARKVKSLFAELSMAEASVHDYRVDLNRTREQLADFKSMYYTAKKKLDTLGQPLMRERSMVKMDKAEDTSLPPIDAHGLGRSVRMA